MGMKVQHSGHMSAMRLKFPFSMFQRLNQHRSHGPIFFFFKQFWGNISDITMASCGIGAPDLGNPGCCSCPLRNRLEKSRPGKFSQFLKATSLEVDFEVWTHNWELFVYLKNKCIQTPRGNNNNKTLTEIVLKRMPLNIFQSNFWNVEKWHFD